MQKDFDSWNSLKREIDSKERRVFCNAREIWWASIGLNVGSEEDGKNDLFERPVLIIKVFNRNMVRIVPLTKRARIDQHHVQISFGSAISSARLNQLRTISTKRLSRKMNRLDNVQFDAVTKALRKNLL